MFDFGGMMGGSGGGGGGGFDLSSYLGGGSGTEQPAAQAPPAVAGSSGQDPRMLRALQLQNVTSGQHFRTGLAQPDMNPRVPAGWGTDPAQDPRMMRALAPGGYNPAGGRY